MRNIMKFAFFITLAFVLTACGSDSSNDTNSGDNEQAEEQSVERELLELSYEVAAYDAENNTMSVSFDTNLPNETVIYRAVLKDEEGTNRLIEYEITIDEASEIAFSLDGIDPATLINKEYQLVFELNVTERTNSNLFTDKALGGTLADMEETYKESELVLVTDLGVDDAYTISLGSANSNPITEDNISEVPASE